MLKDSNIFYIDILGINIFDKFIFDINIFVKRHILGICTSIYIRLLATKIFNTSSPNKIIFIDIFGTFIVR